jgi:hypothetical protein
MSLCDICLKETRVHKLDRLEICSSCLENIKKMEKNGPVKISKEQMPGGIKEEL